MTIFKWSYIPHVARGHYVNKAIWIPFVDKTLPCQGEEDNIPDPYVVAVKKCITKPSIQKNNINIILILIWWYEECHAIYVIRSSSNFYMVANSSILNITCSYWSYW